MKATSTHIALAVVAMYGVLSSTYLYGQANKNPVNPKDAVGSALGDSESSYKTIQVERADAAVLAKQLLDLIPGAAIVGDARTNQIIIHGQKQDIATAEDLIKQLDVPNPLKPRVSPAYAGPPIVTAVPGFEGVPSVPTTVLVPFAPGTKAANPPVAKTNGGSDVANELMKQLLPLLAQLDQFKNTGNTKAAQHLQVQIAQLIVDQARLAEEKIQRAKQAVERANEVARRALAAGDDQAHQFAEQDRQAAEESQRTAEQALRTTEQIKLAIESRERTQEVARRALEVEQRIAALSAGIQKLEAGGELTDKQKAELDDAKQQLKVQLNAQFDQRQQVETLELKQLRERLDKLEKELSDRAQNRDNQINQRFQELTSPASQQGADKRTTTIKASNLTLENVNGAKQLTITSPSEITIRTDITTPPGTASADSNAPELIPDGSSTPPAASDDAK